MIESKETLTGNIASKLTISGGINVTTEKVLPELENLTIIPTTEQQVFTHENSYGYDNVTVNPIPEIKLQDKDITINENGIHSIVADDEYDGLNQVNVTVDAIEDLTEELETYNNELTEQETTIDNLIETLKNKGIGEAPKYAPRYVYDCISFRDYQGTELEQETQMLDTTYLTNMGYMFYRCTNLTQLDLSGFNTSNVTNMSSMFGNCKQLTSLDLSNFNTSKVTRMNSMFYYCEKVTSLNLSSFDTLQVTNMSNMFTDCKSLTSLDVSNFDTSQVTNMSSMFFEMTGLTSLDVSNFDTSNVTNMSNMFRGMVGLTKLDLSNFNTSNVTDMSYMFGNCKALTKLDIRNFVFDKVTSYSNMFINVPANCEIIVKDETAKAWVLDKRSDFTNIKTVAEL